MPTIAEQIQSIQQKVEVMNQHSYALTKRRKTLINEFAQYESIVQQKEEQIDNLEKALIIVADAAKKARVMAKDYIEESVTNALRFITQSNDYEFVMQENDRGGIPTYDIFIKTMVDGNESLQNPEDSNGGGFVDIISVAIKNVFLQMCSDPRITHKVMYMDEPGKMISDQMSVKFAEFIKLLSDKYGLQVIMITHNKNIANIADKSFIVEKDSNGSKVSRFDILGDDMMNMVKTDVLKFMEGEQDGAEQDNDQEE